MGVWKWWAIRNMWLKSWWCWGLRGSNLVSYHGLCAPSPEGTDWQAILSLRIGQAWHQYWESGCLSLASQQNSTLCLQYFRHHLKLSHQPKLPASTNEFKCHIPVLTAWMRNRVYQGWTVCGPAEVAELQLPSFPTIGHIDWCSRKLESKSA